jgi:hypothetical protein
MLTVQRQRVTKNSERRSDWQVRLDSALNTAFAQVVWSGSKHFPVPDTADNALPHFELGNREVVEACATTSRQPHSSCR